MKLGAETTRIYWMLVPFLLGACGDAQEGREVAAGSAPQSVEVEPDGDLDILGDVNGDLEVNIEDALLVGQVDAGLVVPGFADNRSVADVNCDRVIDAVDALLIARYHTGLIDEFPCQVAAFASPLGLTEPHPEYPNLSQGYFDELELPHATLKGMGGDGEPRRVFRFERNGLGVEGGEYDGYIDGAEAVSVEFDAPMTAIAVYSTVYTPGAPMGVEAYSASGDLLEAELPAVLEGVFDASEVFPGQAIQKLVLRAQGAGTRLGAIAYSSTSVPRHLVRELDLSRVLEDEGQARCYADAELTPSAVTARGSEPGASCWMTLSPVASPCTRPSVDLDLLAESTCDPAHQDDCPSAVTEVNDCLPSPGGGVTCRYAGQLTARGERLEDRVSISPRGAVRIMFSNGAPNGDAQASFSHAARNAQLICGTPRLTNVVSPSPVR